MKIQCKARDWNRLVISAQMQLLLKARSCNCTGSRLQKKRSVCEKRYYFPHSITNETPSVLFNGYFSVVDHPASFGAYRTGGIFVDDDIIVGGHYNSSTIIAGD